MEARVYHGLLEMEIDDDDEDGGLEVKRARRSSAGSVPVEIYREQHSLEGVSVEVGPPVSFFARTW